MQREEEAEESTFQDSVELTSDGRASAHSTATILASIHLKKHEIGAVAYFEVANFNSISLTSPQYSCVLRLLLKL
ncbi:unnamed protein product [Hymenolepis diminuta]|uniref:Uncharacterized protein n=1 Tax=Hymenolepis diminuta TaxID=6216 RepID=A0A0R3SA08_HYMDI|nr:unnamed protein product [Hymenolepis diminuta]